MEARIDCQEGVAVIANDLISLEVRFDGALQLAHLVNRKTGTDWIPAPPTYEWGTDDHHTGLVVGRSELWPDLAPASREFLLKYSITADEESLDPTEVEKRRESIRALELSGAEPCSLVAERSSAFVKDGTARLDLTVALADHPLEVTVHTEMYEGQPIVRRWTSIRNTSDLPVLLHKLLSLMLSVRPGYADLDLYWVEVFKHEQMLWRQSTVHQERISATVRRKLMSGPYSRCHDGSNGCMAWAALRDPSLDEGMFIGWEWSGVFDTEIGDFREGAGVFGIRAGFSDEGEYHRVLKPDEIFSSPKAFFGFFVGDAEEAGRTTRKAAEQIFALPWPDGRAPMFVGYDTWNNWQDYIGISQHLKPERLDREIELAARLGAELFILDYDWFPRIGDWWSDPARFPEGVESVSSKVKAAGMKFGIWMGFGQVHADSQVAQEHPEWLVTENAKATSGGWTLMRLCLGYQPCRDWVLDQITRVVDQFGVDWLKHDFELIPISDAHHHAPAATDSRIETVLGYYYIMEKLHERFPNLYLDNWTQATGAADFGNYQRHHSTMIADWYSAVTVRSSLNGISHLFPSRRTHAYLRMFSKNEELSPYHYRSGSFGNGMYLLNDILQWEDEIIEVATQEIRYIKEDRDLFLDGEVYTLIPRQPDHYGWEARFVHSALQGRGMAQVFRNHDPESEKRVVFRGLDAGGDYDVCFVDTGQTVRASGCDLLSEGVIVHLDRPFSSAILRVRRSI